MKRRSTFDETRDQRVADEGAVKVSQMCVAHNCPNRWTVDKGDGKLCSAHAWRDPREWPSITNEQQWHETERAQKRSEPELPAVPMTLAEKKAILHKLQLLVTKMRNEPRSPMAWAHALRGMEEAGLNVSDNQKQAWREALRVPA